MSLLGWHQLFGDDSVRPSSAFQGPSNEFDSGFLNTSLDSDGNGFVLDGLKATDSVSGKSVTMHGTLRFPS